ncbi:BglG family transcription antiterminator [Niallia taxi]|uniref:BglG family transcription antiterminator n=1 Tax=Niallia taxi TaxID=2499688 RepID=UPI0039819F42
MFADNRKNKIFTLLEENLCKLNGEKIGEVLSISDRTVRKEIKGMNEVGKNHGFIIKNMRGKGFYIDVLDQQNFRQFKNSNLTSPIYFDINTKEGRIKQCIIILLNAHQFMTLEELAEKMYVGRTTLSLEIKEIRNLLNSFNLSLHSKVGKGILIEGSERNKRCALLSLIDETFEYSQIESYFGWKNQQHFLEALQKQLPPLFSSFHLYFSDENLKNFIFHLVIMADRIQNQFVLELEYGRDKWGQYTELMDNLIKLLSEVFLIDIPQSEQDYLFIQVRSKMITAVDQNQNINNLVNDYIQLFLDKINENYFYDLNDDEQLRSDLQSHINSMLFRVKNNIRVRNPMEEHIKKYFPLAYEITLYAVKSIKNELSYEVNHGEIAYLSLHIGASLERNYQVKYERHNSCLIVCGSGIGTARVIETTIKQTIPDLFITKTISAQRYSTLPYVEEDVVITTIDIEEKNKPIFKIESLPSRRQIIDLDKKITKELSHTTDLLLNYFSPKLFIKKTFKHKDEAIKALTSAMALEKVIDNEQEFLAAILKREEMGSTVIGEGVAVPHPLNLLSKRTQIGIALTEEPIDWGNGQKSQLIFLLAISKEDYEEAMGIYDFLVDIIREKQATELSTARNFNEFILKARMIYS